MRKALTLLASVAALFFFVTEAGAVPIVYTITGAGSGTFSGAVFTDRSYTFTLSGDTTNLVDGGVFQAIDPLALATVDIAGFGNCVFLLPTRFGINSSNVVFFSRSQSIQGSDFFDFSVSNSIPLTSSFGPVQDIAFLGINRFEDVPTPNGVLSFNSLSDVTLSAVAAAVPEPATWAMMVAGFALAGSALRCRNRRGHSLA